MLIIKDLDQLEITKIKAFVIYFTYEGSSYMLHEESDGPEYATSVWARNLTEKGFHTLERFESIYGSVINQVLPAAARGKKGLTYAYINQHYKSYFVKKLASYKLVGGLYAEEVTTISLKYKEINEQINALRKAQGELWNTFFTA